MNVLVNIKNVSFCVFALKTGKRRKTKKRNNGISERRIRTRRRAGRPGTKSPQGEIETQLSLTLQSIEIVSIWSRDGKTFNCVQISNWTDFDTSQA